MLESYRRSNNAHKRLKDRYGRLHRKHQYHLRCIQKQNLEKRILPKKERKKIWNDLSVVPLMD